MKPSRACTTSSPRPSRRRMCEHVLLFSGDANMNWAARLSEEGCRMVYVRHEHCALAAAMAYSRKNWEVAWRPSRADWCDAIDHGAPRSRARPSAAGGVRRGSAAEKRWYNQEIDQAPLITATGAAYHSLHMPSACLLQYGDAFLQARRERRPVVIGIPFDLQARPWDGTCGSAQALAQIVAAPFADSAASRRRGQRRATGRWCRTGCRAGRPGCGRSRSGRRLPGLGRQDGWPAVDDASGERTVP